MRAAVGAWREVGAGRRAREGEDGRLPYCQQAAVGVLCDTDLHAASCTILYLGSRSRRGAKIPRSQADYGRAMSIS